MAGDTDFHLERLLSQETYNAVAVIYALLSVAAFILNSLVMFTFYKDRSLFLPTNLLILSVSLADWLIAVMATPLGAAANASEAWSLGRTSCVFYAFVTATLGYTSIMHHTAIAIERYLAIASPYMVEITTNQVMKIVIVALWCFSLFWSVFPLLGWSAYVPEAANTSCSIRWQSVDVIDASYVYAIFACFFFAPIVIISTAYILMYQRLQTASANAVRDWGWDAQPTLEILSVKSRTTKMSLIMFAAFLIGWSPYAVVSLYAAAGNAASISPLLGIVPSMFAKTTTCYNPVIYFFMCDHFRESLKRSLRSVFRRNVVAPEA